MRWITLPHQLNNRKFTRAVVFVHGLNGSAASWRGGPNRFVDRLSRERPIYNHFGLFVFEYQTKIPELGRAEKLFALIPGASEIAQKAKFNVDMRRVAMQLKASLSDLLEGYKTIVLVGHGMGGLVIKRALVEMNEAELKRIRLFITLAAPPAGAAPVAVPSAGAARPSIPAKAYADFTSKLTDRFSRITSPPETCYIDSDDPSDAVLEIDDPNTHVAFNKVLALLLSLMPGDNG